MSDLAGSGKPDLNDAGTPGTIDTQVTQASSRGVLSDLAMLRKAHGAESAVGHGASNLLEALPGVRTYERPAWAAHPIQTLAWRINWQAERMAALKAAQH